MQVERVTRERIIHRLFTISAYIYIHHFHSVHNNHNESYLCLTPGGMEGQTGEGVEQWKCPCFQKGRNTGDW